MFTLDNNLMPQRFPYGYTKAYAKRYLEQGYNIWQCSMFQTAEVRINRSSGREPRLRTRPLFYLP